MRASPLRVTRRGARVTAEAATDDATMTRVVCNHRETRVSSCAY
jgi:hypothetical protein